MGLRKYTARESLVILVLAVTISFAFFMMFLGVLRTFEVNEYFGSSEYDYVKRYCVPKGFFGWGYDCDIIRYNKDLGLIPFDYQEFPFINSSSFTVS
jgi:hypothetical protein